MFDGATQQEPTREAELRPAPVPATAGADTLDDGLDGGADEAEIPEPPVTGDPAVDEALGQVRAAMTCPLPEQVQAYEAVHRALQDRLADVGD